MNKIEELLKNEKVEWKKLGDIAEILNGYSFKSGNYSKFGIRIIRISDVQKGRIADHDIKYYPADTKEKIERYLLKKNDLVMSLTGNVGRIAMIKDAILPAALNQRVACIRVNNYILSRYLYHYLLQDSFEIEAMNNSTGGGQKNLSTKWLKNIKIPIPSLKTQEKIVKTLDKFTNYVAELQAELQARGKQYEYYRDELLSEENLKIMSEKFEIFKGEDKILKTVELEDVAKIRNGKDWKTLGKGSIPVYGSGGKMDKYVDKYSYNKPTVLIPRKGSIQNVFYLEEAFWNVDTIFYTEINDQKILPKYLFYFIENYDVSSLSTDSTRPSLTQSILNKIKLTLPSISVQNKIVQILDKFQNLVSQTQGLLPEEIEQRQKQYEYYREKLLTFDLDSDTITRQTDRQTDNI